MTTGFKVEFTLSEAQIRAAFGRLREFAGDLSPLMQEISGHLAATAEDSFEREADPWTGMAWAPLRPGTIEQRTKRGKWPGPKLQVTGLLAASIVAEHGSDYAEVAAGQSYAPYLQLGTKHMVARPFLGISDETEDNILGSIQRFLAASVGSG